MTNPLLAAFAGQIVLVDPAQANRVEACLAQAAAHPDFAPMLTASIDSDDFWPDADDRWGCRVRPYTVKNGVLQIPVKGVLLHDFPYALGGWATGYEYIWQAFRRGCGDFVTGAIKGIALVEDTPGGMVAGCFDAVDKMVALKTDVGVPVRAFAHEAAYSAGYAVATVADQIVVSRTGGVGSIGVVTSHINMSGALDQAGIKITFIASDPSKVEGNYTEPLADDAKARIQSRIDELYSIFVAAVARSRGLSEDVIRGDLKAYCYTATQATSNGLADEIGTLDDAIAAFAAFLDDPSEGDEEMTTNTTGSVDQAAHDTAVSAARADGLKEGAAAATTRIGAILGSEEATGRDTLAAHFAFKTDMPAEAAIAALKESPKAQAAATTVAAPAGPDFSAAMDAAGTPAVGGGDGGGDGQAAANPDDHTATLALAQAAGVGRFNVPAK